MQAKISQLKQHFEILNSSDEFAETYQKIHNVDDFINNIFDILSEFERYRKMQNFKINRDQKSQEIEILKNSLKKKKSLKNNKQKLIC